MTGPFVVTNRIDDVLHVELSRPDRLNAVSDELYADLERAMAEARDPSVRAVLVSGAGRAFCAGADLKAHSTRERTPAERRSYVWAGQRACRDLQRLDAPVVVAVHGYAIGAGAELALSGDVILVSEAVQIRLPEIELGTFVGGGVTNRLPLLVGTLRAKQLLMLGRPLDGREAVEWGIAAESVPEPELMDRAWEVAHHLAGMPALSMRLAKQGLERAGSTTTDEALVFEAESLLRCMSTDDWSAGVQQFGAAGVDDAEVTA